MERHKLTYGLCRKIADYHGTDFLLPPNICLLTFLDATT